MLLHRRQLAIVGKLGTIPPKPPQPFAIAPPKKSEEFSTNVQLTIIGLAAAFLRPPPLTPAELYKNAQPATVGPLNPLNIPPPAPAVFSRKTQCTTVGLMPMLNIPPPVRALFPVNVEPTTVAALPTLCIPPPFRLPESPPIAEFPLN
jgi:hypothetical protein